MYDKFDKCYLNAASVLEQKEVRCAACKRIGSNGDLLSADWAGGAPQKIGLRDGN